MAETPTEGGVGRTRGAQFERVGERVSFDGRQAVTERQAAVLRALVAAYVGRAGPVASRDLAELIPSSLSPASIRNTLGELHEAGLIAKAHASAGRVPTPVGMQLFVDQLLEVSELGPHHQRLLERELEGVAASEMPRQASHLLSEHTRQLGFVIAPRVDRLTLRSLHLVPVAQGRVLAILVAENGGMIERVIDGVEPISRRELERIEAHLAERISGRTLRSLRRLLEKESGDLRGEASGLLKQAWSLGLRACEVSGETGLDDLVIATRLALLDQPEFSDPDRIRGLFSALETNQRLLELLRRIGDTDHSSRGVGLSISLGAELGEPGLRDCALVAVAYGADPLVRQADGVGDENGDRSLAGHAEISGDRDENRSVRREAKTPRGPDEGDSVGVLGVIGPQRMDYGRVIPLVHYCSELVARKLRV